MTTLAWRDGILAADTKLILGDSASSLCHKIYLLGDGKVLAAAGDAIVIEDLKGYLLGKRKSPPKNMKEVEGIFLVNKEPFFFSGSSILMPIEYKFHAEGAGWQYAFAGMHIGLSAIDAVKLAGEIDTMTNTLVDSYNVETQELTEIEFPKE